MYPTDLKETQWQYMEKILLMQARKRKHNLKEIWNAIFYVVKTGIDLCLSVFWWARFPKKKDGIEAHTLYDIDRDRFLHYSMC